MKCIPTIGAAIGGSGSLSGAEQAPDFLKNSLLLKEFPFSLDFKDIVRRKGTASGLEALGDVAEFSKELAQVVFQFIHDASIQEQPVCPLILAGDHSSAIGTWSGVAKTLDEGEHMGILWVDAHMDSHTPKTSHSGNIHGMPLATLLGYGDERLTNVVFENPKLLPEHTVVIGARSFESEEKQFLDAIGVKIFYADEILDRGLELVFDEALERVREGTIGYGISFDLDSLDPAYIGGVGTPVSNGLSLPECCAVLKIIDKQDLMAFELVEFNPNLDPDQSTQMALWEVVQSVFMND